MPPLPSITPEQRADALAKAVIFRAARADVKNGLKRGDLAIADVLRQAKTSDVHGGMKVTAVLTSMPGVGKVRAAQIMDRIGIAENRKVRGLGANQRAALLEEFGDDLAATA